MRLSTFALASFGFLVGGGLVLGGGAVVFADEPAPAASPDTARIQALVEDLASADFRVREAAWKALVGYGEKARPALEAAVKRDDPAVRFRAEQLLARLDGGSREKPLDDGTTPPAPSGRAGGGSGLLPPTGPGRFFTDEDFARLMRETEERMRKLQEELRRELGGVGPSFGPGWTGPGARWLGPWLGRSRAERELRLEVDGASLRESPRGARLELHRTAENGTTSTTVLEGKTFDGILAAHPEVAERPEVKALIEKRTAELAAREKAERERAERAQGGAPGAPGVTGTNRSVSVTTQDGKTTVTVRETGPDGKETTKTFEGTDLEQLKRDHPELAEALGGMRIVIEGPGGFPFGGPMPPLPTPGRRFFEEEDGEEDGATAAPQTGPFGLALASVPPLLGRHLGLEAGRGALVAAVRDGSDAAKLGLKPDDVIVSVGGAAVASLEDVGERIRAAKDGALSLDVIRGGKPLTLTR